MEVVSAPAASEQVSYPTLSERIQSTFIDTLFMVVLMSFAASALDRFDNAPDWIRIVLFFGIWCIYEPVCITLGCTLGNYLKGLRVRRFADAQKRISLPQAFLRYVLKIGLGWISFLTIHSNRERRAIHDIAASSIMLKKDAARI